MDDKEIVKLIENLNKDYLDIYFSSEYRLGKKINKLKTSLKKHDFRSIKKYINSYIVQTKQKKISSTISPAIFYKEGNKVNGARGVVYTCITNGYDLPLSPNYIDENCDYLLFTDSKSSVKNSKWEIKLLDEKSKEFQGMKINRYYKMHPFELFNEYDFSIYVDGNVQIISEISSLYEIAKNSVTGIAMHLHSQRNCIYQEGKACIIGQRGDPEKIKMQLNKYKEEGFPHNFGLLEATIIVVDLHNDNAKKIMNKWWNEFNASDSKRDQLSLPYIIWKEGFSISDVGCLGNNIFFNPKFRIKGLGNHGKQ